MHTMIGERTTAVLAMLGLSVAISTAGCARMSKGQKAVAVGVGTGAAVGAVIGNNTGSTARGAIIGAAVGGTIGSIIGVQMDKQARELEQKIPGAVVERVGEGIQVTFASGLLFDFDSDRVRPEAGDNLRNLAASLDKYPKTDLLIVGHTDDVGADAYNQGLSERRAAAAASFLAARGVDRDRIRTRGLGESEPVVPNEGEASRQRNRRVEVAIYANQALRSKAQTRALDR